MATKDYSIQDLCDRTGLARRTIHFYSQQGILPPPDGAGVGAHYAENHLLRLRLIPVLRGQGLRLDEIRSRLAGMDAQALQALFDQAGEAPRPPAPLPVGQSYIHYPLTSGLTLVAPGSLSLANQQKVQELLDFARKLFTA